MPREIPFFLTLFILVMIGATWIAYSRPSGRTGQDPVKLDIVRKQGLQLLEGARERDANL